MKFFSILIFSIFFHAITLAQTSCKELPQKFKSYNEAISRIENSRFLFVENISGNFSSWIDKANYYSCDKVNGYLIVETADTQYIHKNVPTNIWKGFKSAKSKGSFYSKYIRGRYRLPLTN